MGHNQTAKKALAWSALLCSHSLQAQITLPQKNNVIPHISANYRFQNSIVALL